jgi:hypothetical protein
MRVFFVLSAILLAAVAACSSNYDIPSSRPLGVFNVKDTSDGAGGYVVKPTGVFWSSSNVQLPYSINAPDSCIDTVYYPTDTTTQTLKNQLDAGAAVTFQTDLSNGTMTPDTIPGKLITYRYHGAGVPHTPGANVIFNVPGAAGGIPAATQTMIAAKRLILGPIDPAPADSLHLTWGTGQPGVAAVNIYLLYATSSSPIINRQIICSLYDDGDYWLNQYTAKKWKNAALTQQQVKAFRWVTTYNTGSGNLLLLSISEFDTLKTSLP